MSVYRVIDVIGTSSSSWEEAAAAAITTAGGSVRGIRVAEVTKQDIAVGDNGELVYRTKIQLSFNTNRTRRDRLCGRPRRFELPTPLPRCSPEVATPLVGTD